MTPNGSKQFHKDEDFTTLIKYKESIIESSVNRVSTINNNKDKIVDLLRIKEENLITTM